jgi:hypothetical protein
MRERDYIEGVVVGPNAIQYLGRVVHCWSNAVQAAVSPQPLDLESYKGKVVVVSGRLYDDLWEAHFERVIDSGYHEITGEVVSFNVTKVKDGTIDCYRHGMAEMCYLPLNLSQYMGLTITVSGILHNTTLYKASISKVPVATTERAPEKEAKSLNDLLRIRAANRDKIEAVNGNLGTALGYKWTNGQKTDHPCIIIFVPQKTSSWLMPDEEKVPEVMEASDGTWCFTDVVTGGKAESIGEISLPELDERNKEVVQELKSGRLGLIGGIQLAFYQDGVADSQHAFVGTAGIAVHHKETGKTGFLTNQHIADVAGRRIFHPWHQNFPIGMTYRTIEYVADQNWYNGVIDEEHSYVRCDCGFVEINESLLSAVRTGLHAIGKTGDLLRIDPGKMDIINKKVISVGRTRGVQRGTIVGYAYEFQDEFYSIYTDLLIVGEDGMAFSWKGDSGKLIVTDNELHQPIALLWGGWQERLREGKEQEIWTYAIDLAKVLDRLKLELIK